jgi:uncharacterized protein (TIGR01777 family)
MNRGQTSEEMEQKVFITGGTGFVGVNLANRLALRGNMVSVMGRSGSRPPHLTGEVKVIRGDGRFPGSWQEEAADSRLIINLAGAPIFTRWTAAAKKRIRESRILTTANLAEALPADARGVILFSTSAVGYYGFRGDEELDEDSSPGDDFLARLCRDWEEQAGLAREKGARVIITRFGIVLGPGGGALGKMIPFFRRFLGGPLGSGNQWLSWIQMEDLIEVFLFLMEQRSAAGPYNVTSPRPVRNGELARSLGRALHRPALLPTPSPAVRLMLGEFGNTLLKGQRVLPRRLVNLGYQFRYAGIDAALEAILK